MKQDVFPVGQGARKRRSQWLAFGIFKLLSYSIVLILFAILGFIIYKGIGVISWEFLTTAPSDGMTGGGIWPAIVGTFYLMAGSALFAFPVGVMSGIYMNEYAPKGKLVLGAQTGVWAASDTSDQKEGELTLLMTNSWIDESGASSEEFLKVIKQYEEENPGVKITLQGASQQDIKESFQTAALAGGGADIVVMDNSGHAIDLAAMGLLYPLEELTTDEELTAQYQEGPLNSGKFEGKYYSVPWYMDCTGLYYNTERLDELGIDVPTTWEELSDAVDKAKEAGYGGIITYQSAYAFYSFFYQNECPVIDTSGDVPKVVIDNEEGKEAWNYICDLISKGGLVESFKEATTWDKVYESFANGEATFLLGGDWCSTGVENINPDMDYGIAPMVKGKTEATILGGWTWNINVNCKNPELAYDLIQYLNSEKGDSIMSVEGKASARKDYDYAKALEGKDKLKVFAEELSYTKARPAVINEKSIDELITNAILEVDYGQSSAEDALTSLAQKLNENIASNYQ